MEYSFASIVVLFIGEWVYILALLGTKIILNPSSIGIEYNKFPRDYRSCDLDEWSQDQLDVMRVSGNGNMLAFLKKHGVAESSLGVCKFKFQ